MKTTMKSIRLAMICALGIVCGTGQMAYAQSAQNQTLDEILRVTMAELRLNDAVVPGTQTPGLNPNIFGKLIPPSPPSTEARVSQSAGSTETLVHHAASGEKKVERKVSEVTKTR